MTKKRINWVEDLGMMEHGFLRRIKDQQLRYQLGLPQSSFPERRTARIYLQTPLVHHGHKIVAYDGKPYAILEVDPNYQEIEIIVPPQGVRIPAAGVLEFDMGYFGYALHPVSVPPEKDHQSNLLVDNEAFLQGRWPDESNLLAKKTRGEILRRDNSPWSLEDEDA